MNVSFCHSTVAARFQLSRRRSHLWIVVASARWCGSPFHFNTFYQFLFLARVYFWPLLNLTFWSAHTWLLENVSTYLVFVSLVLNSIQVNKYPENMYVSANFRDTVY